MHATVRRYEGIDVSRTDESTKKLRIDAGQGRHLAGPSPAREASPTKVITATGFPHNADSSLGATLNHVVLSSREIVSWGVAFPRPGNDTGRRLSASALPPAAAERAP